MELQAIESILLPACAGVLIGLCVGTVVSASLDRVDQWLHHRRKHF